MWEPVKSTYLFCLDQDGLLRTDASLIAHDVPLHLASAVQWSPLPQMVKY